MKLFEPSKIKDLVLPNRFIRSATWEGLASETGECTPELVDLMVSLVKGRVGLIITGHAFVDPKGQGTIRQLAADRDDCVKGLGEMTEAVHREGGRVVMQLSHAGLMADEELTGSQPCGPSSGKEILKVTGREMTESQIQETVKAFGKAARRAKEAGFDGVQIHSAHGYLLSQFLSPAWNRRDDSYGGSPENRAKFVMEVVRTVRLAVGRFYPVLIKINSEDFLQNGFSAEDFLRTGQLLDQAGIDAIEVSGGTILSESLVPFRKALVFERDQAYFRKASRALRKRIKASIILVGGIRSYHLAERMLEEHFADYVSMSRPFIREPMLIRRWESGDLRKATCISCNACLEAASSRQGLFCVEERRAGSKVR
jgi:2,4-dienoyl-CoA reductase-like NADH-dependent reductase (Old Yellow Enzyme family)